LLYLKKYGVDAMRKLTLTLLAGAAALAVGSAACAQDGPAPAPAQGMTRAQVEQRTAAAFDKLDANHDGKLDKADRDARQAERQKAVFDRLDANHDGSVTYEEFTAMHDRMRGGGADGPGNGPDGRFGRFQGHRPGMAFAGRRPGMSGPDGHRPGMFGPGGQADFFRTADANHDGEITKDEFVGAALQRFDRLDTNKDGTVTPDEAQAARHDMRQQWRDRRDAETS
jgi:hypothetical protein